MMSTSRRPLPLWATLAILVAAWPVGPWLWVGHVWPPLDRWFDQLRAGL